MPAAVFSFWLITARRAGPCAERAAARADNIMIDSSRPPAGAEFDCKTCGCRVAPGCHCVWCVARFENRKPPEAMSVTMRAVELARLVPPAGLPPLLLRRRVVELLGRAVAEGELTTGNWPTLVAELLPDAVVMVPPISAADARPTGGIIIAGIDDYLSARRARAKALWVKRRRSLFISLIIYWATFGFFTILLFAWLMAPLLASLFFHVEMPNGLPIPKLLIVVVALSLCLLLQETRFVRVQIRAMRQDQNGP